MLLLVLCTSLLNVNFHSDDLRFGLSSDLKTTLISKLLIKSNEGSTFRQLSCFSSYSGKIY